jgi:hypothetical protein
LSSPPAFLASHSPLLCLPCSLLSWALVCFKAWGRQDCCRGISMQLRMSLCKPLLVSVREQGQTSLCIHAVVELSQVVLSIAEVAAAQCAASTHPAHSMCTRQPCANQQVNSLATSRSTAWPHSHLTSDGFDATLLVVTQRAKHTATKTCFSFAEGAHQPQQRSASSQCSNSVNVCCSW